MIDLPTDIGPSSASAALIDFGAFLTPPLGGPVQRVDRMGNRFRISVGMPPMLSASDGRRWVSRLIRGKTEGARMPFPLLDFDPGAPGAPLINGAGQTGTSMIMDGFTPNYVLREGQFFSIVTGGRHHLYNVRTETIASNTGTVTLPISPMIRVAHLDNDVCHFGQPMIEGFILGEEFAWSMSIERHIGLGFDIVEAA